MQQAHILKILEPFWTTKTETASRLRGRIENLLDYADIGAFIEDSASLFPNTKGTALSDMPLTAVLRRMGCPATAHGFRSTLRDWAGETTAYPREVIEHALAHQQKDKAEAADARGTLFDKRRSLMVDWARFCNKTA